LPQDIVGKPISSQRTFDCVNFLLSMQGECIVTVEWFICQCHICMGEDLWVL